MLRNCIPYGVFCALISCLVSQISWADGGGLGNLTYGPSEEGDMLFRFDSSNGAPQGHGFVTMHRGYLIVPFSADGGGGNGSGGLSVFDVSDPRNIANVFTTQGDASYNTVGLPNYVGDLREPHGYGVSGDIFCFTTNGGQGTGLEFWDLSTLDPPNPSPQKIGKINLPLSGGDYSPTPWWVFWQGGRYAYVAGTSAGLFIVDASDPTNPVLVNQLPTSQLGGFRVNTVFAVGNILVVAMSDGNGIATLDISDPANPVLLDTVTSGPRAVGYSMMINGNRILGAHDPAVVWDISDPQDISFEDSGPNVAGKGGYGTFQDGVFHYGSSTDYVKLDITTSPFVALSTNRPSGFSNPDWDFATALGNLVFMGNDHAGSALVVHQASPDTTPPSVNMVSPGDLETNVAVTSRIGLTFTDQIDLRSVDTTTFIVRPISGTALPGRYSHQTGIVNFWPDAPLTPNQTYEVVVPIGGVTDFAGNPTDTSFTATFSTGNNIVSPEVALLPDPLPTAEVNQSVPFDAIISGTTGPTEYSWDFGDGSGPTGYSPSSMTNFFFNTPGHYVIQVNARIGGVGGTIVTDSAIQTIHHPIAAIGPTHSSTILYEEDPSGDRVWCVNADNDTVTAVDAATLDKLFEVSVGKHPRTLTQDGDGQIWVACQDDDTLHVIDTTTGSVNQIFAYDYGSGPFGIVSNPDDTALYITLFGKRQLLKFNPTTGMIEESLSLVFAPRGIAVASNGSGHRILVTRFVSPDTSGEILEVLDDGVSLAIQRLFQLSIDSGPDQEDSGRGLPNYISSVVISPDLRRAWIPSKKDNIQRGLQRDGLPLDFESSVRTIASQIDLVANLELPGDRIDFNDADMASAAVLSPLGDYAFIALQGINSVRVVDGYSGETVGAVEQTGLAPQGLVLNPGGTKLYVHHFMSRSIQAYDTSQLTASTNFDMPSLGTVSTVASENLSPEVLLGKQIFYNAKDPRMNLDQYLSCASCHLDGGQDGRTWDFTDRGEGIRNTIPLNGRSGMLQGRVHWTANFDEIQDFENDIRNSFGGSGFLSDADYFFGSRQDPLGDPKEGLSPDLDALAAYVSSLNRVGRSPYRTPNGNLTAEGELGRDLFNELQCFECHGGFFFTDSPAGGSHDVGTITVESGMAIGRPLTGIDTPTLRGLWNTEPYLHHGGAQALYDVLSPEHGVPTTVTASERDQLVQYLLQIDDREPPAQGLFPSSVTHWSLYIDPIR